MQKKKKVFFLQDQDQKWHVILRHGLFKNKIKYIQAVKLNLNSDKIFPVLKCVAFYIDKYYQLHLTITQNYNNATIES